MKDRPFNSFADFRKELRGSHYWSTHIDEIADQIGKHAGELDAPFEHAFLDNFEDLDSDLD